MNTPSHGSLLFLLGKKKSFNSSKKYMNKETESSVSTQMKGHYTGNHEQIKTRAGNYHGLCQWIEVKCIEVSCDITPERSE